MASDDLEPGSTIDGFRIEQRVHTGGMATLWRVTRADCTGLYAADAFVFVLAALPS